MDRRLVAVGVFVLALGGVAFWLTAAPESPSRAAAGGPPVLSRPTPIAPHRAPTEEVLQDTPTPALVRAGPQPGDDVEERRRLEVQASLAAPYWARLAPHIQDPALRTQSTEMFARLNRLDEPAAELARAQYDLTQALIARGGLDRKSQSWLDYLNSTSAAVLQDGDASQIPTPEQAATRRPGAR